MGYIEMADKSDINVLFAWLVEEVGELGRSLIRKRSDSKDTLLELGDVWNVLHAVAFKLGYTPSKVKTAAEYKSKNHEERSAKEVEPKTVEIKGEGKET